MSKESRRATSTQNTTRIMARDQHRYCGTITKIEWKEHYHGYCWQVYQNIWLKITTTNVSSEKITKIYRDEIWKLRGIPRRILSNRGPQFASRFIEELMKILGTKRILLTAYYPQTDRQIERINWEIGTFLRYYVNYQQDDWTE